jgi:hypothetical protein
MPSASMLDSGVFFFKKKNFPKKVQRWTLTKKNWTTIYGQACIIFGHVYIIYEMGKCRDSFFFFFFCAVHWNGQHIRQQKALMTVPTDTITHVKYLVEFLV